MSAIFRRELLSYFISPIGYIFLAAFYAFSALFFNINSLSMGVADLRTTFQVMILLCLILIPLLTMKTFSQEKAQKTDQCLLTAPVSLGGIVVGKFLAAFLVFSLAAAVFVIYAIVISAFAKPDWTLILSNFVGLELLGAGYISIGLLCSCLTQSQMVSAVTSFVVMTFFYLLSAIATIIPIDFISNLLQKLSFLNRYYAFSNGLFDFSNIIFFVSVVAVSLFLTIRVLESRRWN